ncbi:MAG: hypothetical protein U5K74_02760 [Gemmatimonadaceae bacterium]|nr:hypothetical protein [Gemmatimonadaceae bacterium]
MTLEPGLDVQIASATAFLAMKWEAFAGRGAADPMSSHDLEDLITIVAGRDGIVDDVNAAPDEVRHFIHEQTAAFLAAEWAPAILEGNLPDARRVPGLVNEVAARFQRLAAAG